MKRIIGRILAGFLVILIRFALAGQAAAVPMELESLGSWPGYPRGYSVQDAAIAGHYVYLASEHGLTMLDISRPSALTYAGSYNPRGSKSRYYRIALKDSLAFVGGDDGLTILDLSDPTRPVKIGALSGMGSDQYGYTSSSTSVTALQVAGNRCYLIHDGCFAVVDITDPQLPSVLYNYRPPASCNDVQVHQDTCYLSAGQTSIDIYDVRDPKKMLRLGGLTTEGGVKCIRVQENRLYVAEGSSGLSIYDLKTPAQPALSGRCRAGGSIDNVEVAGNLAYVCGSTLGLHIFDVTDAAQPKQQGLWNRNYLWGLAVNQNSVLTTDMNGVFLIDVQHPIAPEKVGEYETRGGTIKEVFWENDHLYINDSQYGFGEIDLRNLSRPKWNRTLGSNVECCAVKNHTAYMYSEDFLSIIDLDKPEGSDPIGRIYLKNERPVFLTVSEGVIYAACGFDGVLIVDARDPSKPSVVSRIDTADYTAEVAVSDHFLYTADLDVFDVSHPAEPRKIGECPAGGLRIKLRGGYALVVDGNEIQVIDMANPSQPRALNTLSTTWLETPGRCPKIADFDLFGQALFLSEHWAPGEILEISDLSDPFKVGSFLAVNPPRDASILLATEDWVFTVDGKNELVICANPIQAEPTIHQAPMDAIIRKEDSVTFDVRAFCSETMSFQWYKDGQPLADTLGLSGSHTSRLLISNATEMDAGEYVVEVKSATGSIRSPRAVLAVNRGDPLPTPAYTWPGYKRGDLNAAEVSGRYAYLATGQGGMEILDIQDPEKPVRIGGFCNWSTHEPTRDLRVVGNMAYLAWGWDGLVLVDISSPWNPSYVSSVPTDGIARAVELAGAYAYVAANDAGLKILDVSNPAFPRNVGTYAIANSVTDVAIHNHYALVAHHSYTAHPELGYGGFDVVDISQPGQPRRVSGYHYHEYNGNGTGTRIRVYGSKAYVSAGDAGLLVVEISDPASPRQIGNYNPGNSAFDFYAQNNRGYLAAHWGGLFVLDMNNPGMPEYLGSCRPTTYDMNVTVAGHYAYLGDLYEGLRIVDVSNPRYPRQVGGYITGGMAHEVRVTGSTAFIADGWNGFQILDVGHPEKPVRLACIPVQDAVAMEVSGRNAFVVGGRHGGFYVFDISQPRTPVKISQVTTLGSCNDIYVNGPYAYVGEGYCRYGSGIEIFDIRNLTQPQSAGFFNASKHVYGLMVSGTTLYASAGDGGMLVLDISNPTNLVQLSQISPLGFANGIDVFDDKAYVTCLYSGSGFNVIDVMNPTQPKLMGKRSGSASNLRVIGDRAYVANGTGVLVLDLTQSDQPGEVNNEWTLARLTENVEVRNDYIYVAEGYGGLSLMKNRWQPTKPQIMDQPQSSKAPAGGTACITIHGLGEAPLRYEWQKDGQTLQEGAHFHGVQTASLRITDITRADEGLYTVLLANEQGSVISLPARLILISSPNNVAIKGTLSGGTLEIWVDQTVSDREYRLQVSGNLEVWNDLMTFRGNGQAMTLSDANAYAHSMRFYRIISP
ncbi:MAG TPA: immunoglobulin domain-containing protein [Candidatus Paceibacterota bacterium]|nr:immunoglobulin domain-containing protein [Verrucomicrobiota bacterium]HRY47370.1 immunoglobulin domain-containing protein [Candidatus Paceibacterota bacterium]